MSNAKVQMSNECQSSKACNSNRLKGNLTQGDSLELQHLSFGFDVTFVF
jgi:hypothetical protein